MKAGTYLGGVRTLADLRERCRIVECGCWEWGMGTSHGRPSVSVFIGDKRQAISGRRAAILLRDGVKSVTGLRVWAADNCENELCVNPSHCKVGSDFEMRSDIAQRNAWKMRPHWVSNGLKNRWRLAKLTQEQANEIRELAGTLTTVQLAERFGVSRSNVRQIVTGNMWKDPVAQAPNASVFTWRPAA